MLSNFTIYIYIFILIPYENENFQYRRFAMWKKILVFIVK